MIKDTQTETLLTVREFLDDLAGKGVKISLEGERLKIAGGRGGLSPGLMSGIRERKEEILSYIRASAAGDDIIALEEQEHYPLSHAQQRLWVIGQFPEVGAAYNLFQALTVKGTLCPELFNRAMLQVIEKHESLRTVFIVQHDEPRQRVCSLQRSRFAVDYKDLSAFAGAHEKAQAVIKECILTPFNLGDGPLVKVALLKAGADEFILALAMHHIVSDGWSMEVLTNELITAYSGLQEDSSFTLQPLPVQYRDFTIWQNKKLNHKETSRYKDYWMQQLGGELPVTDLAWEKQRPPAKTYSGATAQCVIPAELVGPLKKIAEANGATMFMVMLAAFKILLARYTGKYDVIIGTPAAGRDHTALGAQIGFYVNTLPVRTRFSPSDPFNTVLDAVKKSSLGAFSNQLYPFDKLVDDLSLERKVNFSPVFDIMLSFLDHKGFGSEQVAATETSLEAGGYAFNKGTSQFDLSVFFYHEHDFLIARFEYNTDILTAGQVNRIGDHLLQLLHTVAAGIATPVCHLPLFWEETASLLLSAQGDQAECSQTLADRIRVCSEEYADRTALAVEGASVTYAVMQDQARRMAYYLVRNTLVKQGEKTGIYMHVSPAWLIAASAIIQAGGVCVPLSPGNTQEQIDYIINDSGCRTIIHNGAFTSSTGAISLVNMEEILSYTIPACGLPVTGNADAAFCLYGEMANAKGCMVTQQAMVNAAGWLPGEINMKGEQLRFLAGTSCNDVITLQQIFAFLLNGCAIVFVPAANRCNTKIFLQTLMEYRVHAVYLQPPFIQALLVAAEQYQTVPPLHYVFTEGRWLSPALAHIFYRIFPLTRLTGITSIPEYGIAASAVIPPAGWQPQYAGKPISNTRISIRDSYLGLLPAGATGELYITGKGLAQGYNGREATTKEKFPVDSTGQQWLRTGIPARWQENGHIEFTGERSIKINGHVFSPAETAKIIASLPGITHSLLKVHAHGKQKDLVLYYTGNILPEILKEKTSSRLPYYMVPGIIMQLPVFPLTPFGDIDEQLLPEPVYQDAVAEEQPANETEQFIMQVWQRVLKHDRFSVTDNFFMAGGHSLKAFQVLNQVNGHFGLKISLTEIFGNATVRSLAALVGNSNKITGAEKIHPLEAQQWYSADHRQMKMYARIQFAANPLPYNITRSFALSYVQKDIFDKAIGVLVEKHEALRTSFRFANGQLYQVVHAAKDISSPAEYSDLQNVPGNEQLLEELITAYHQKQFDFTAAPLWRIALVRMKEDLDVVVVTMQHIISDGPSLQMLVDDFNEIYKQTENNLPVNASPSAIQLKEYCAWQNKKLEERGDALLAYWKKKITPSFLDLPVFPGQPAAQKGYRNTFADEIAMHSIVLTEEQQKFIYGRLATARPLTGAIYCTLLPAVQWEMLGRLASKLNSGYFNILAAALSAWVYHLTGRKEMLIGAPVSYRFEESWQPVIGYLVELMPLPLTIDPQLDFSEAVRTVTRATAEAQQHLYPFEQLLSELDHSIHETGNLLLHLRNLDSAKDTEFPAGELRKHSTGAAPQFRLNIKFDLHQNGLVLYCEYWPELITAVQAESFAEGYINLLQQLLQDPFRAVYEYRYATT